MLRKESEAVSEGNGPVHQEEKFGFGQPALADEYREIRILSKQQEIRLDIIMRLLEQFSECLEHKARQPRLAMKADGPADTKTRERTEGAATAIQAMRGDDFSARRVEPGPNTNSTSFGVKAEPPALSCRDNVVVESGDAASESYLPSLEMRSSTAAGGVVPAGEAFTATETTSNQPLLRFYATEEMNPEYDSKEKNSWTSVPSASYDSSSFWRLFAAPYCYRVVNTNQGKIGLLIQAVRKVTSAPAHFWDRGARWFVARLYALGQLVTSCSLFSEEIRWLFEPRPVLMPCQEKVSPSRAARGYINWIFDVSLRENSINQSLSPGVSQLYDDF